MSGSCIPGGPDHIRVIFYQCLNGLFQSKYFLHSIPKHLHSQVDCLGWVLGRLPEPKLPKSRLPHKSLSCACLTRLSLLTNPIKFYVRIASTQIMLTHQAATCHAICGAFGSGNSRQPHRLSNRTRNYFANFQRRSLSQRMGRRQVTVNDEFPRARAQKIVQSPNRHDASVPPGPPKLRAVT
jgi:hypothetical protein